MTHFEKIKSMSVEEMADMINKIDCEGGLLDRICVAANPEKNCDTENCNCISCIIKWLKSEVGGNE